MQANPTSATRSERTHDGGAVKISEWDVGTPERQDAAIAAIVATWSADRHVPGLRSYRVYRSRDGRRLLHHSAWESEHVFLDYQRRQRDELVAPVDRAVPGIERLWLDSFRHDRSYLAHGASMPGACTVLASVETDSPALQRTWIDTVVAALGDDEVPGLLAAHFYTSEDGRRIVNVAHWESADAHERALHLPGSSSWWQHVRTMPGVRHRGFMPYHAAEVIVAGQEGGSHAR